MAAVGREIDIGVGLQAQVANKEIDAIVADDAQRLRVGDPAADRIDVAAHQRRLVEADIDDGHVGKVDAVLGERSRR